MSLPAKDFTSAWPMKAQSQLEQSQVDIDLDADIGMCDAENAEESGAMQKLMLDNFKDCAKRANDFIAMQMAI